MKLNSLKFLTVCLVTLAIIAPSLVTCGVILEEHIKLEKSQSLIYEVKPKIKGISDYTCNRENIYILQKANLYTSYATNFINHPFTFEQQKPIFYIFLRFIFFVLPCGLYLGLFLYNWYCAYRTAVLKKQVKVLEKLWQQSIQY